MWIVRDHRTERKATLPATGRNKPRPAAFEMAAFYGRSKQPGSGTTFAVIDQMFRA
jgi:hypothetical protein